MFPISVRRNVLDRLLSKVTGSVLEIGRRLMAETVIPSSPPRPVQTSLFPVGVVGLLNCRTVKPTDEVPLS